jgi:uncharacterized membrane protein
MVTQHNDDGHVQFSTGRLEAFSDGVMAIIITISVLQLKIPEGATFASLLPLAPLFVTYVISFQVIGTYWNNHHHLLKSVKHVSAGIMWFNLLLLFWLSLIPFATDWLGTNHNAPIPTAVYSFVLLCCALSYFFLQAVVVRHSEKRESIMRELTKSKKGLASLICYFLAVVAAFFQPIVSDILIVLVAFMWFIPDRRIEKGLERG